VTSLDAALKLLTDGLLDAARDAAREVARQELQRALARGSDEWITQAEAARRAGVTPQTVRQWLAAGYLGDPGRRGRVNAERLRQYLGPSLVNRVEKDVPFAARELAASVLRKMGGP